MEKYQKKEESEENDIVEALIKIPQKNLEDRITQLEADIKKRQNLSNESISAFSTHQVQLKDRLEQLEYLSLINGHRLRNQASSIIIQLEEDIIRELINCFRDISELKEKLLQTNEELEIINQKLKLLE